MLTIEASADSKKSTLNLKHLLEAEALSSMPQQALRLSDLYRHEKEYKQAIGGDLFDQFVRFLFPISGRERRTMFLPLPYWGPKKPQYKIFDWKKFETSHFEFFAYPEAIETFQQVSVYLEEDYERNNRTFGVQSKFTKKIPIILYQSRKDFEQTFIVSGVVPEGLGGVTEIFSWKRATFPFEGQYQLLEHVAKHEGTHIYQIAKEAKKLPLWFIEGNAETNSIYWDADAEMIIRDAFLNGFFFPIKDLWRIQGSWLMYKEGNFITNLIWKEYGEEGFRKIYDKAKDLNFEDNLKKSLNLSIDELDVKVQAELSKKYSQELKRKDIVDGAHQVESGRTLLHARGPFYLSGGANGPRIAIYINYVDRFGKVYREKVVSDREFQTESLNYFKKGAWMDGQRVIYSVKKNARDEIRIVEYSFNEKSKKFKLGKPMALSWKAIDTIESPVFVGKNKIAFIGYTKGYSNIYCADLKTRNIDQITDDNKHYSHLDYSPITKKLVVSREEERAKDQIFYNRDLFFVDPFSKKVEILQHTADVREEMPRFSPDGSYIVFVASGKTIDLTYDLYLYHIANKTVRRMSRAKVGAKNPQWGQDSSIYFNSYKEMRPIVYQTAFPKSFDMLKLALPEPSQTFLVENDKLVVNSNEKQRGFSNTFENDGFIQTQRAVALKYKGEVFTLKDVAVFKTKALLRVKRGMPDSKRVQDQISYRYFLLKEDQVESLDPTMVAIKFVPTSIREKLQKHLQGRPIIDVWQGERNQVLALVNNRLATDHTLFKKKSDVSLIYYDVEQDKIKSLPENIVDEVQHDIQWVSFVESNKILFAIGEKKSGPYRLVLLDLETKKSVELEEKASRFRVSKDHRIIAWYREGQLFFVDEFLKIKPIYLEKHIKQKISGFHFIDHGKFQVFASRDTNWFLYEIDLQTGRQSSTSIDHDSSLIPLHVVMDETTGNVVIHAKHKDRTKSEELLHWSRTQKKIYILSDQGEGFKYSRIQFRHGYLFFTEHRYPFNKPRQWVWNEQQRDTFDEISKFKRISNGSWVMQGSSKLLYYNKMRGQIENIAQDNAGFVFDEGKLFYSAPENDEFKLFLYDTTSGRYEKPIVCEDHCISPLVHQNKLLWTEGHQDSWGLSYAPLYDLKTKVTIGDPKYHLLNPTTSEHDAILIDAAKKIEQTYEGVILKRDVKKRARFIPRTFKNEFKLQSLSAAAAFDGSNVRFFVSGFLDNMFSDRGIFVDSIFLGDARFATAGYADLRYGNAYTVFFNSRDGIKNFGGGYSKTFLFDRFREVNLYSEFEVQDYGAATPDTSRFVTPDVEYDTFYLFKVGAAYGYDATSWDLHGPVRGSRFFFKAEGGMDVGNQNISNLDVNVDYRLYHQLLPRFGFAHRIVAGTSQGDLPNVFLVGGNISFRGVGFDDLNGQNYWVFSEDLRLPVFDFVGAKFFDPVDQFLGLFTRFFDIRSGIYADIGQTWFNGESQKLRHSVGYFVNVPTLLGINFRFNQGFIGEKDIGIWLGTNW
ncbi:MAG: PD40 domain-containing protein [Bdellovibrionales bacterium]|nr:PD40 domain-containing protein [Bdellovibrionales bacterium]